MPSKRLQTDEEVPEGTVERINKGKRIIPALINWQGIPYRFNAFIACSW